MGYIQSQAPPHRVLPKLEAKPQLNQEFVADCRRDYDEGAASRWAHDCIDFCNMGEPVLKKFGKYFLLDRIGEGGMAEIFRARVGNIDSNGRLVVIKRIHAASSQNQEFVQMFRSEIQVTMRFSHPNIVQLFEAGVEDEQEFIAMELVDGKNLRQLLSRAHNRKETVPIEIVCYVVEQVATGLHYAHTFKDKITGQPLNVIHRDVSPQNLLVSFDGAIKVIDFGIAKAATNSEATRAGVIKGKLSYLSPEQVMGEVLDARSDVFALGIVLWEALTGKRLFVTDSDNEFQVLKMIEACQSYVKPPSEINPNVPRELDFIVLQALARDRKKRYQSADELARAIRRFASAQFPEFSPSDVAIYAKKMFSDFLVEDRKQLQSLTSQSEQLLHEPEPSTSDSNLQIESTRMTEFIGDKFASKDLKNADKVEVSGLPNMTQQHMTQQLSSPSMSGYVGRQVTARPTSQRTTGSHQSSPPRLDKERKIAKDLGSGGGFGAFVSKVFAFAVLSGAVAGGFYAYKQGLIDKYVMVYLKPVIEQVPIGSDLETAKERKDLVDLAIHLVPDLETSQTNIYVNREMLPAGERLIKVKTGESITLVVERPGYETYRKEFSIDSSDVKNGSWEETVRLEPMTYGRLSITTVPPLADVTIRPIDRTPAAGSKPWVLRAPFEGQKIPIGRYELVFENKTLGMGSNQEVTIGEGSDIKLNVQLDVQH